MTPADPPAGGPPGPASAAPGPRTDRRLDQRRLRWYSAAGVALFVALLHSVRSAFRDQLAFEPTALLLDLFVAAGFLVFLFALLRRSADLQEELDRRNRELMALHAAALDIQGDLTLDSVLQGVVDRARDLLRARYGALSVLGSDERIQAFVTSGLSAETRQRIGDPPKGHGLLGVVLHEGQSLRLTDLSSDPRSVGFPTHHPSMRSLLAVPIPSRAGFRGNLYLADRDDGSPFTEGEQETLARFAVAAAVAIDRASLHERLRTLAVAEERARIAHDLHDGTAQVLAYVNTKAQAADQFLRAGRSAEASAQLDELARAAREVYSDVREGILGLRSGIQPGERLEEALARYLASWEQQSGVAARLDHEQPIGLAPTSELQVLRVVQEALANVRKHAAATRVHVALRRGPAGAVVEVRDDGAGFDPENLRRGPFPHFGIATMRERAETIGARFSVHSTRGEGTTVRLDLPAGPTPGR
jgi:signal transduction histidine kinase